MNISVKYCNILAVCTGNICRSPMAEGILRGIFKREPWIRVSSAGTHAINGNPAAEFAIIASFENGTDISGHRATILNTKMIYDSNVVLCMEPSHLEWVLSNDITAHSKVYNLADFSDKNRKMREIPDPYGSGLRDYRECFNDIKMCVENFCKEILFFF